MARTTINEQLLDQQLTELETSRSWSPRVVAKLEAAIRTADDYDLFRINPIQFAAEKGIAEKESIDLFLYGTKYGLFEMEWHLVCAFCAHVVESFRELTKLHPHFFCDFCGAENHVALDDYIHVSFTLSSKVRDNVFRQPLSLSIEDYYLKYHFAKGVIFPGEHTLNEVVAALTKLMAYVEPKEKIDLEFDLGAGMLTAKDLSRSASLTYFLGEADESVTSTVSVQLQEDKFVVNGKQLEDQKIDFPLATFHFKVAGALPRGKLHIQFNNLMGIKSPLWMMYYPPDFQSDYVQFESFLSGKKLLTTQTFRNLFRFETVTTDEGLDVKDITLLFTDLKGSTALYERIGDLKAYYLVRQHFTNMGEVIAHHSGTIVKTIGDAIMAAFMDPKDAVRAAIGMLEEMKKFNQTISDSMILKIGIHRGPSIMVTVNDRLDYFGQTVNIAARIQGLADAGEIYISQAAHEYEGVKDLLGDCEVCAQQVAVKGISEQLDVYKVIFQP